MSANQEPAAAPRMKTVRVRAHCSLSGDEADDPDHVHHVTEDVPAWLGSVVFVT